MNENGTGKEQGSRTINELADLDYSEMTNEEIELMIEWRAENKARDDAYKERMNALHRRSEELKSIAMMRVEASRGLLNDMRERAHARYEKASAADE